VREAGGQRRTRPIPGEGFGDWDWGSGFGDWEFGIGVWSLGFKLQSLMRRAKSSKEKHSVEKVQLKEFRETGAGFRVQG